MATAATARAQRDQVYCHECHMDWFRDEHGLVCPNEICRSDFVEIIENGNDPRGIPDLEFDESEPDDEHDHSHGIPHLAHHQHQHQHQHSHAMSGFGPFVPFGAPIGGASGTTQTVVRADGPNFSYVTRTIVRPARGGPARGRGPEEEVIADLFSTMLRNIVRDHYNRPEGSNRDEDYPMEGNVPPLPHGEEPRLNPRDAAVPQAGDAVPVPDIQTFLNSLFGPTGGDGLSPFVARFFNGGHGAGGDYVYSQSELDRIISQLMEQHQGNAPPPAEKEDIEGLPRLKVTQAMVDDNVDCAVCKDDLVLDEEVTVLPCKHSYHFECVSKWLVEHDTCPICRHPITPPEKRQQQENSQRQPSSPGGGSGGSGSGGASGGGFGGPGGGGFGGPIPGGFPFMGGLFGAGLPQTRPRGSRRPSSPGPGGQNQDTPTRSARSQSPPSRGQSSGFPGSFPADYDEENQHQSPQHQNQQNQNSDGGNGNGNRTSSFANLFRRRNS